MNRAQLIARTVQAVEDDDTSDIGIAEIEALLAERRELLARQVPTTPAAEPRGVFELLLPEESWRTADAAERAGQGGTLAPSAAPTPADQYSEPGRASHEERGPS